MSQSSKMTDVAKETAAVGRIWIKNGVFGFPLSIARGLGKAESWDQETLKRKVLSELGGQLLRTVSDLGPVYGKMMQVLLSRYDLSESSYAKALSLTDVYGQWPAMPFTDIELILDKEIPNWRKTITLEKIPLGCASMAQVHAARDQEGRRWVVKIIKPDAERRLKTTVGAIQSLIALYKPLAVGKTARRFLAELRVFTESLLGELDLIKERQTIEKMKTKLSARKTNVLKIPEVHPELSNRRVLVLELFDGVKLSDVAAGKVTLSAGMRKKLARKMLKELLVQVFEMGLFHGDPHAGNLILLEDGAVGLFDWGLSGELFENDRIHIAAMLRAVMTFDLDQLALALKNMSEQETNPVSEKKIRKELDRINEHVKKANEEGQKLSLQEMMRLCLNAAQKLDLRIPEGLLLMSKSLMTIEGLAKGIDPDIRLSTVATPYILKAARPRIQDLIKLGRKAPEILMKAIR